MATWAATDDFEAGSDIALNGASTGSGWDSTWGQPLKGGSYSDFKINTTQVKEGARAVQVDCSSASAYIQRGTSSGYDTGSIYFAVRASQIDKICYVYLTNGAGSGIGAVRIGSDGNLSVFTGSYTSMTTYSADTWYWVNIEWDQTNQVNKMRGRAGTTSWGAFSDWGSVGQSTANITDFQIEQAAASGADFWLDEITTTDPFASTAYSYSTSQVLSLSDSRVVSASYFSSKSDQLSLVDDKSILSSYLRSTTETLSLTDISTVLKGYFTTIIESLSSTDLTTLSLKLGVVSTENITLADASTEQLNYLISKLENISENDNTTPQSQLGVLVQEALSIIDVLSLFNSFGKSVIETLNVTVPLTTAQQVFVVSIIDAILNDSGTTVGLTYSVTKEEALTLREILIKAGWSWQSKYGSGSDWTYGTKNGSGSDWTYQNKAE